MLNIEKYENKIENIRYSALTDIIKNIRKLCLEKNWTFSYYINPHFKDKEKDEIPRNYFQNIIEDIDWFNKTFCEEFPEWKS